MNTNEILTADVLDIIFEGRNKAYGAYELRKTYNQRILTALSSSALLILLLYAGYRLTKENKHDQVNFITKDIQLVKVPDKEIEQPEVIPPKPKEIVQVRQIQVTVPLIVNNNEVPEEEMPPTQEEIADAKISLADIAGEDDNHLVSGPVADDNKGIIAAPQKPDEEEDKLFLKVEVEAEYPGGLGAWMRFLSKSLSNYPSEALEKEIQGTVVIRFIVDTEGNVSEIAAERGPEELRAAAVQAIRKSGKWVPAQQNGRKVKSYKLQPITFRLSE